MPKKKKSKKTNKKKNVSTNKKVNWLIHINKNGYRCQISGKYINNLLPGLANFHTHGMEQYNHPDFQLVLDGPLDSAASILHALCLRVRAGERFKDGDYVKGILVDQNIRLDTYEEHGRNVLRVMIPDGNNFFPDDPRCDIFYRVQLFKTENLYIPNVDSL